MTATSPDKPIEFPLDRHVFFLFGQLLGYRNRALNRALREFGLDYQRWRVLAVLNENPGCSMQQLADLTAVDRTTATYTLKLMVRAGLVRRAPREVDRRSVALSLQPAGKKLLARILPVVLELNRRCVAGFSESESTTILRQLRRMVDNLKE
jgi:DNA-binding MarR family transcriptional regulator